MRVCCAVCALWLLGCSTGAAEERPRQHSGPLPASMDAAVFLARPQPRAYYHNQRPGGGRRNPEVRGPGRVAFRASWDASRDANRDAGREPEGVP